MRANMKLAISGGQNEPRHAIAGILWAILKRRKVLEALLAGTLSYLQVFQEFTRWISPTGISPRRIAKPYHNNGINSVKDARALLMFSSANRDETYFDDPNQVDPWRDTSKSISPGAGPYFCATAWASRSLNVNVALPMLLKSFTNMTLSGPVEFKGWAIRGLLKDPVTW